MIHYRIALHDLNAHLFEVTLRITGPAPEQLLSLPVWIPGSYLVREFARHLGPLTATQGGRDVPVEALGKASWRVRCSGRGALSVQYRVYAFDTSVRAAFLDARRGFFNATSLCLRVQGREAEPHRIELRHLPANWQVATAMRRLSAEAAGRATYESDDYDELVDHPFELGRFWRGEFEAHGVPHEYVVAGALPDFDGARLLADARRICQTQIGFWHGKKKPPFGRYVFLHNLVEEGHGGLEHRASTALISPRRDMPQQGQTQASEGYAQLLGLVSHEYFHAWNVKRLRPAELARYDYAQENYTELLWFFEGFTSYYDDLLLLRAGLIDARRYLQLLARTVTGVLAAPGRRVHSVAQASFDAWIKYYRSDENTPNATVSYYTKGSLVALVLDLTLRAEGHTTLDDVMRALWARSRGGPIREADIAEVLQALGGRSYAAELAAWVHGTGELPLSELLARFGVDWTAEAPTLAQQLGVRVAESSLTGVKVQQVLHGGAAQRSGWSAGDEILAVEGWRVRRLEEARRLMRVGQAAQVLVARDQRVLSLALTLPPPEGGGTVALTPAAAPDASRLALRKAWLGG